jgi:Family of unknown function (DUF6932)
MFGSDGNLKPGIHNMSWNAFLRLFGTNTHRLNLLSGLKAAILSLALAGCQTMYVDGSYVTLKELPEDYDACWDINGVDGNKLDPVLLKFDDGRRAMKLKYKGDLFPAQLREGGSNQVFLAFFQSDKNTGAPKGIVKLNITGIL